MTALCIALFALATGVGTYSALALDDAILDHRKGRR